MASSLLGSFPRASSITAVGSCWRSNKCADNYYASSYVTRSLWRSTGKLSKEYCIMTSSQDKWKHHNKSIEGGSTCDKFERKYFMNATSTQSQEPESQASDSSSILESIKDATDIFRKFSVPYALIDLVSAILSMSLLAVENLSDISPTFVIGLLQNVVAAFCMHIYVCGLNQIADVEIDKINKPYLPLASGKYSFRIGVIFTTSFLFMAFGFAWIVGSRPLLWGLFASFVLMTAYSINLPLLRWKRFTILTVVAIAGSKIAMFNLAPFLHMKTYVLRKAATYPRSLIFTIAFMGIANSVISLAKDIPDIEGDKASGIQTLSVRLGPKRVFWFCISLLEMAYGVAILVGATSPFLWSKIFTVLAHAIMALILWYYAKSVDLKSKVATQSFYMAIFKLVLVEYMLIPFVR